MCHTMQIKRILSNQEDDIFYYIIPYICIISYNIDILYFIHDYNITQSSILYYHIHLLTIEGVVVTTWDEF